MILRWEHFFFGGCLISWIYRVRVLFRLVLKLLTYTYVEEASNYVTSFAISIIMPAFKDFPNSSYRNRWLHRCLFSLFLSLSFLFLRNAKVLYWMVIFCYANHVMKPIEYYRQMSRWEVTSSKTRHIKREFLSFQHGSVRRGRRFRSLN